MPTIANTLGAVGSAGIYTPMPGSPNSTWTVTTSNTSALGAGGGGGSWGVATGPQGATGSYILNIASSWPQYETTIDSDVIIKRPGKTDLHVAKTLEALMERLSVIEPNLELMEKYPALREAYENYKVMEALLLGGNNEDENE